MREILSRLRAALSPMAAVVLAALLLFFLLVSDQGKQRGALERRIARTLSSVEGAGKVEVTILERELASAGGGFSAKMEKSVPSGAVAVAQGADDPLVALALEEALCALLGLPPSCVSVITGGK